MQKEISRRKLIFLAGRIAAISAASSLVNCTPFESGQNTPQATLTPTSTPTAEPTITPTPIPEKPAISVEMTDLKNKLSAEIAAYLGQTAISVTDVLTGEAIDVNGSRPQLPGCVANLACALTAVDELSKGTALFKKDDIEPHLVNMVRHSDPNEGLRVATGIGGSSVAEGVRRINLFMKKAGMFKSFYDHPPAYDTIYSAIGSPNWIVANEMNSVLEQLAKDQLFEKKDFDWNLYALWVMSGNKPGLNFMIPGQIPESEATVFHKVGWVPGQPNTINDSGIVSASDHRFLYAITFMYQNFDTAVSEQSLYQGPGTFGSKLSKIIYDTFVQRYSL